MTDTIEIKKEEYIKLLIIKERMYRLEGGGVVTWKYYNTYMHEDQEISIDDFEKNLKLKLEI